MTEKIILLIIGIVVTAIEEIIRQIIIPKIASWNFRSRHDIPNLKGTHWSCEWFYENDELYIRDEIEIKKWTKAGMFEGEGHQLRQADPPSPFFNYPIKGEISPSRVVVLTYKADKYPTEGHIGMACMQLTVGADQMLGHWCGLASGKLEDGTKVAALRHGKVKCTKVR